MPPNCCASSSDSRCRSCFCSPLILVFSKCSSFVSSSHLSFFLNRHFLSFRLKLQGKRGKIHVFAVCHATERCSNAHRLEAAAARSDGRVSVSTVRWSACVETTNASLSSGGSQMLHVPDSTIKKVVAVPTEPRCTCSHKQIVATSKSVRINGTKVHTN